MGLDNAIYALSNVNALMGSTLGYVDAKNRGANTGDALMGFGLNVMNGAIRNEAAKDIRDRTGSYLGYAVNSAAGYGTPEANYRGTMGLIGASMLTSPFGIFGCGYSPYMMPSMIYGGGMGMWAEAFSAADADAAADLCSEVRHFSVQGASGANFLPLT
ncbi:MAG: hypothetical protein ACLSA2_00255 [Candidatus Gastranaerophilaceae bacterium]